MKQSLELRLGQRLTMTPQLQQAIRLLQLSAIDLQSEIQQALEENPLLEENEDVSGEADREDADKNGAEQDPGSGAERDDSPDQATTVSEEPGDWDEHFEPAYVSGVRDGGNELSDFEIDHRNSAPTSLADHLLWQMRLVPMSELDRKIALTIIDSINEDGYLGCSLEELHQLLVVDEPDLDLDEITAVLHQIQNFDPVGVGARDLRDCLLIQLRHIEGATAGLGVARSIISDHLHTLGNRDFAQLQKQLRVTTEELSEAVRLIQGLHPRPGSAIAPAQPTYIVPDIIVKKIRGQWHAELNPDAFPQLRINRTYQSMLRRGGDNTDQRYIQDQLQEARWFLKSLQNRNETLLKVARSILKRQQDFFEYGDEAMRPMVLHDIAETLGMHESTISRATTQKYMITPRGIFELKYFFSSHVTTADGGTCSSTAIRSLIKKFVETEPPTKPISDSKIAKLLEEKGINVARRTVAKYREHMNIPPSNQRKSLV